MKDKFKDTKRKMFEVRCVVESCFCSMDLFLENVASSSGGIHQFSERLKNAETKEDFENLVNMYI